MVGLDDLKDHCQPKQFSERWPRGALRTPASELWRTGAAGVGDIQSLYAQELLRRSRTYRLGRAEQPEGSRAAPLSSAPCRCPLLRAGREHGGGGFAARGCRRSAGAQRPGRRARSLLAAIVPGAPDTRQVAAEHGGPGGPGPDCMSRQAALRGRWPGLGAPRG